MRQITTLSQSKNFAQGLWTSSNRSKSLPKRTANTTTSIVGKGHLPKPFNPQTYQDETDRGFDYESGNRYLRRDYFHIPPKKRRYNRSDIKPSVDHLSLPPDTYVDVPPMAPIHRVYASGRILNLARGKFSQSEAFKISIKGEPSHTMLRQRVIASCFIPNPHNYKYAVLVDKNKPPTVDNIVWHRSRSL